MQGRNMAILRSLKRSYTFILLSSLLVLCLLKLYVHHFRERRILRSVTNIDPWTKRHWFRLTITDRKQEEKTRILLLWTQFFSKEYTLPPMSELKCPVSDCIATTNRSMLSKSDAVLFHLRDIHLSDMPTERNSYQRWVLVHHESPPHTPNILKYFNNHFNWTVTYRLDSDVILNPLYVKREESLNRSYNVPANKSKMAVWFVSNCKTPGNREGYVKELQKIIDVDIYGECGTHKCFPKMSDKCLNMAASDYHFYLSFENSICKDYATEKLFEALDKDIVPVVFGGANYTQLAPPGSYIDALSFSSPESLGNYLLAVANDSKRYNSYFQWRNHYVRRYEHYFCKLCEKLHNDNQTSWHRDLNHWWFDTANCKTWSPIHETL